MNVKYLFLTVAMGFLLSVEHAVLLKYLFQFPTKLIGTFCVKRQQAANCMVHVSFLISFVFSDWNDWQNDRTAGMTE